MSYGTKYSRMDQVKFMEDSLHQNFTWSILEYFVPDVCSIYILCPRVRNYVFKVNNSHTRTRHQTDDVFIVNFEHILLLVSIINFERVNAG